MAPELSEFIVNYVYGTVATNSKIDGKTRGLAIVGNIMGQVSSRYALSAHLKCMLIKAGQKKKLFKLLSS